MYRASRGSTLIRSPTLTNSGTATTAPVSRVAGLVTFETVSPLTPGSVSETASSTDEGSWSAAGLPLDAGLGLRDGELDGRGKLEPCRLAVDGEDLHGRRRQDVRELVGHLRAGQR